MPGWPRKAFIMFKRNYMAVAATVAMLAGVASTSQANGVCLIDNFEGYVDNLGSWTTENNGISVALDLRTSAAIAGNQDLGLSLGANVLGGGYQVKNQGLNVTVPNGIDTFDFQLRPLLGLNLGKTVTVSLTDNNNNTYISPVTNLPILSLGTIADIHIDLLTFSPPLEHGTIDNLTGVVLNFVSPILSLQVHEEIDGIQFTVGETRVEDWNCY